MLGNFCMLTGQGPSAAANFTSAIAANPNDQFGYYRRAAAYAKSGQPLRAISDYDSALRINPKFKQAKVQREKLLKIIESDGKEVTQ
jgi:tetratricopeptide (TPR) repeat protein